VCKNVVKVLYIAENKNWWDDFSWVFLNTHRILIKYEVMKTIDSPQTLVTLQVRYNTSSFLYDNATERDRYIYWKKTKKKVPSKYVDFSIIHGLILYKGSNSHLSSNCCTSRLGATKSYFH